MFYTNLKSKILFALIFTVFLLPAISSAQLGIGGQSMAIIPNPSAPKANQTVQLSLDTSVIDLSKASVSWFVGGKLSQTGIGLRNITANTGKAGSIVNVSAIAKSADGQILQASIALAPADVELLIEPISYAPPFYRGGTIMPYQGVAKIVALPEFVDENGKKIDGKNLIYQWKEGSAVMQDYSGYGKNVYYANGGVPIKPIDITADVSTIDNKYFAEAKITLNQIQPIVSFYQNDPALGILFNKKLSGIVALPDDEMTISAVPFYFGAGARSSPNLKYAWSVNGNPGNTAKSDITLRRVDSNGATAAVSADVGSAANIFQFNSNTVNISIPAKNGFTGQ